MLSYFSGYRFIDDDAKNREACCCEPIETGPYGYNNRLSWDDWSRYASWFSLFKELDFITKDDTVYAYLCTQLGSDLDPLIFDEYCGDRYSYSRGPLLQIRQLWSNHNYGEGVKDLPALGSYGNSGRVKDLADIKFPKELIKMADNYRRGRTSEFVGAVIGVVAYSDISSPVPVGTCLPKEVITAVEGFNPVTSSLNSIVENCKTLYATVSPSIYRGAYDKSNQKAYLQYDPSRDVTGPDRGRKSCVIGPSFSRCQSYLAELLRSRLKEEFGEAILENDHAKLNMIREAICAVIGTLVHIYSLVSGDCYASHIEFLNGDFSDNINMLRLKETNDKDQTFAGMNVRDGCGDSTKCMDDRLLRIVAPLAAAAPDAALCLGDVLGCCGSYTWNYRVARYGEYLAQARARPTVTVMQFLRNEVQFQLQQKRICMERINRFRMGVQAK